MSIYGVMFESKDKTNYGVFTVAAKNDDEAMRAAYHELKGRKKKNLSSYTITLSGENDLIDRTEEES